MSTATDTPVEITARILRRTDSSILIEDGTQECWLPLSQVEVRALGETTRFHEITLPEWLAVEKRLL